MGHRLRLGVFGGAFDPPHAAHLALARAALEQLALDELRVIPTGDAWHKSRTLSPAADRLKMCELAFADLPKVHVDDRELLRSGPSYTIDTLEALRAEHPDGELFLLMGGDQWRSFSSWHRWQDILPLASLAVVERPQIADSSAPSEIPADSEMQAPAAVPVSASWPPSAKVFRLHLPAMPISATAIRQRLVPSSQSTAAQTIDAVTDPELAKALPEPVARYISLHGLYQARPSF
jgi:nicotinate-nucleotide adenylyltransferase